MADSGNETLPILIAGVRGLGGGGVADTATMYARLRRRDERLEFNFWINWLADTAISGTWEFQLPWKLAVSAAAPRLIVPALAYDLSADRYYTGVAVLRALATTSPTNLGISFAFGTNAALAGASTPFTWAVGDWLIAGNALEAFDG